MPTKDRGFKKLKGKTIEDVQVSASGEVDILCDDGSVFTIAADVALDGTPLIDLYKQKKKPDDWPFPTSEDKKVYPGGSKSFDERKGRTPTPGEVLKKELKKKKPPADKS